MFNMELPSCVLTGRPAQFPTFALPCLAAPRTTLQHSCRRQQRDAISADGGEPFSTPLPPPPPTPPPAHSQVKVDQLECRQAALACRLNCNMVTVPVAARRTPSNNECDTKTAGVAL